MGLPLLALVVGWIEDEWRSRYLLFLASHYPCLALLFPSLGGGRAVGFGCFWSLWAEAGVHASLCPGGESGEAGLWCRGGGVE